MTKIIQKIKNLWNKIINWIVEQYNKFLPKQLMKVVLVLLLCSSVNTVCLPPLTYPTEFKDEYTCLLKGIAKLNITQGRLPAIFITPLSPIISPFSPGVKYL